MQKGAVIKSILARLEADLQLAIASADSAKDTATSKENIAENKYDTLGLEAAYLAHGQSNRAQRLGEEIQAFNALRDIDNPEMVSLGSLVSILDTNDTTKLVFIGPGAAGLTLEVAGEQVVVVTPSSPLGSGLLGLSPGDIALVNGAELEIAELN